MCRQIYERRLIFNRVIASEIDWEIQVANHKLCRFKNLNPVAKEYLSELEGGWVRLVNFICETSQLPEKYIGIKGIECLDLEYYEGQNRLLESRECTVFKTAEGKIQVCFCCLMPCVTIRLLLSPNEDTDIEEDNSYADEAVGFIIKQLEACWKVFPRLLNKINLESLLVRKFKNVTCSLLLSGSRHNAPLMHHFVVSKEQIQNIKASNLNEYHADRIRRSFPKLKFDKMYIDNRFKLDHGCCGDFDDSDSDSDYDSVYDEIYEGFYGSEDEDDNEDSSDDEYEEPEGR